MIKLLDKIIIRLFLVVFIVIFVLSIFFKAMYNMDDYPYFKNNTIFDIVMFLIMLLFYFCVWKLRDILENRIKWYVLWLFFGSVALLFVCLLPLKPFSDMYYVSEGAFSFAKFNIAQIKGSDYLQMITKNMKVSLFYSFFLLFLPKKIISLKIINIILYICIAQFISLITKNLGFKYPKVIFIFVASFVPLILYCNHIYFDLPVLCMCSIGVYFYTKGKTVRNCIFTALFLSVACCLRVLGYIFVIAILFDLIFVNEYTDLDNRKNIIISIIILLLLSFGIPKLCDEIINHNFRTEDAEDETIWSLFWMGINEEEFGFMHTEFGDDVGKSFEDFYNLLISRDVRQNCRLFGRKILWTWTQGTYQSQRYGLGGERKNELDKFEYKTRFTRLLLSDSYFGRRIINLMVRAQYMALYFMMLVGTFIISKNDFNINKYRLFIYIMLGTFLILVFYELKSRYVLHCIIPMLVIVSQALEKIDDV